MRNKVRPVPEAAIDEAVTDGALPPPRGSLGAADASRDSVLATSSYADRGERAGWNRPDPITTESYLSGEPTYAYDLVYGHCACSHCSQARKFELIGCSHE